MEHMKWHVYEVSPIDVGWEFLPTASQLIAHAEKKEHDDFDGWHVSEIMLGLANSLIMAQGLGWEGDFSYSPRVFFLPNPDHYGFAFAFVWKQGNNGTTYIASPYLLPWLGSAE